MAIVKAGKEMIWQMFYSDRQSAIQLVKNPVYYSKRKHILRRYHFTYRAVEDGDMFLEKIEGAKNPTDMLTKCVDVGKLGLCKTSVGLLLLLLQKLRCSKDVDDEEIFFLRMYFLDD